MRIRDILSSTQDDYHTLNSQCSDFILESGGMPIIRSLPSTYSDFHKVKVRKRKSDRISDTFNEAFEQEHYDLRQRAVFANGISSYELPLDSSLEPFYVFPVNGYNFMYSKEVRHSGNDYQHVFESIISQLGDRGNEVLTDLLRFTYTSDNLQEGIEHGAEIILYGIPYYYAVRASSYHNYQTLLTSIVNL